MSSSTLEIKKKKKKAFYYKMVLEPSILEYCVAWYSSIPSSSTTLFFLIAQFPPQQCHDGKTNEELEFHKLEYHLELEFMKLKF